MQKVFVGLSGGVDSAVSAALLKQGGYDVTGAFIKVWQPAFVECTWEKDRIDAMRVAAALDIPFREIDLSDEYERDVVREMTENYKRGYTPNPDVSCNERIKFGAFARWAFDNGAEYVATGHYARIEGGALLRGVDPEKDQSYFLYRMPREYLAKTLFPVGTHTKKEVRALARKLGLPVAGKRDSQGLCFVGDIAMRDFLRRFVDVESGDVIDISGKVIGRHDGAALYTIGQRHGFFANAAEPHYVVALDVTANTLTVSPNKRDCERGESSLTSTHWLADIALPARAYVQARYREAAVPATLGEERVSFTAPHIVSPGQDIVVYDGDRCLGGAKIA